MIVINNIKIIPQFYNCSNIFIDISELILAAYTFKYEKRYIHWEWEFDVNITYHNYIKHNTVPAQSKAGNKRFPYP